MDLKSYRGLRKWSQEHVAQLLRDRGLKASNGGVVAKHERGERFPDPDTVEAYREITDGAVRYEDWTALRDSIRSRQPQQQERKAAHG